MSDAESNAPVYVLQYTSDFFADVHKGWEHFRLHASETVAEEWEESLIQAVVKILENPLGYQLADEYEYFRKPMRRMLHRRTPSSVAYRVLFFVDVPVVQPDGTTVTPVVIVAAIHGSAKPLTQRKSPRIGTPQLTGTASASERKLPTRVWYNGNRRAP